MKYSRITPLILLLSFSLLFSACNVSEFFGSKTPDRTNTAPSSNAVGVFTQNLLGKWSYLFVDPNLNQALRAAAAESPDQTATAEAGLRPDEGSFIFSEQNSASLRFTALEPSTSLPAELGAHDSEVSGIFGFTNLGNLLLQWNTQPASQLLLLSPFIDGQTLGFSLLLNGQSQVSQNTYFRELGSGLPLGLSTAGQPFRGGVWYLGGRWGFETLVIGPSGYVVAFLGDGLEDPQVVDGYLKSVSVSGQTITRLYIFDGAPENTLLEWDFLVFDFIPGVTPDQNKLSLGVDAGSGIHEFKQVSFTE